MRMLLVWAPWESLSLCWFEISWFSYVDMKLYRTWAWSCICLGYFGEPTPVCKELAQKAVFVGPSPRLQLPKGSHRPPFRGTLHWIQLSLDPSSPECSQPSLMAQKPLVQPFKYETLSTGWGWERRRTGAQHWVASGTAKPYGRRWTYQSLVPRRHSIFHDEGTDTVGGKRECERVWLRKGTANCRHLCQLFNIYAQIIM